MQAFASRRLMAFRVLAVTLPILATAVLFAGYVGYRELRLDYTSCGPYGVLDEELGWRLRERSSSCLKLENRLTGEVIFDTKVFINARGFRDSTPDGDGANTAVLAIGDSWTFGYGVNYEQSYPYVLGEFTGLRVANAGVPAYGAAGTMILLRRALDHLRPTGVVYLAKGLWTRSTCDETSAPRTLVPCFVRDRAGTVRLVRPSQTAVASAAANSELPGGALTSGHRVSAAARLLRRTRADFDGAFGWFRPTPVAAADDIDLVRDVLTFELQGLLQLAREFAFTLVLVDPLNGYQHAVDRLTPEERRHIVYFGQADWGRDVETRLRQLRPDQVLIPEDWHYTPEANWAIASALAPVVRDAARRAAAPATTHR